MPPKASQPARADAPAIQRQLRAATALFHRGQRAAALHRLHRLRQSHPKSAAVWMESALAMDRLGHEAKAVPLYQRALRLGLQGAALRDALICVASSLREVGRSRDAVRHLERACRLFPGNVVVRLFLALGYHDLGRNAKALRLLAMTCLDESRDTDVLAYRSTLARKYRSLTSGGCHRSVQPAARRKK